MVGCPSSITAIDGVVPPIVEYHEHGGAVGLGTDQAPGPGGHNALREARTAAMLAKADSGDPTALDAAGAIELATIGGARVLGVADSVGSLSPGKRADIVLCDMEQASVAPTVQTRSTRRFPIWCTVPAATRFATCSSTASNASPTAASSESTSTVWSTTRSSAPSVSLQMRKLTGAPLDHRSSRPLTTVGSEKPDCHRLTR